MCKFLDRPLFQATHTVILLQQETGEKKWNLGFANFYVKFLSVNFACPFETKNPNYSTKEDERNKITRLGQIVQLKVNWFHFFHISYNNFPSVAWKRGLPQTVHVAVFTIH